VRLVLTNDDGIEAAGLDALAAACAELGHEVRVLAPDRDMSGMGAGIAGIGPENRIAMREASLPSGVSAHALSGTPGMAAMLACLGRFGDPPEAIVSGINAGPNTGHATLHSGTVGAALTAATFGVSALAVSAVVSDPMRWDTACMQLETVLAELDEAPAGTVLNLNAPACPPERARELRWATLDRFGSVRLAIASVAESWVQVEYRSTGRDLDPGSDTALLAAGHPTLTAIEGVSEAPLHAERHGSRRPETVVHELPPSARR
jgi:5'-nucleotidase